MVTFVQATYALVTFVQISNISAVTGPILTKFFGPNFLGVKRCWTNILFDPKNFSDPMFNNNLDPKFYCSTNFFWTKIFWIKIIFDPNFSGHKTFWTHHFLDTKFLFTQILLVLSSDLSWFNLNITNKTTQFSWGLAQLKLILYHKIFTLQQALLKLTLICHGRLFTDR